MISVTIFVNNKPIFTRSAVRKYIIGKNPNSSLASYEIDDGSKITHDMKNGAVKLAIKILKTIKEVDEERTQIQINNRFY